MTSFPLTHNLEHFAITKQSHRHKWNAKMAKTRSIWLLTYKIESGSICLLSLCPCLYVVSAYVCLTLNSTSAVRLSVRCPPPSSLPLLACNPTAWKLRMTDSRKKKEIRFFLLCACFHSILYPALAIINAELSKLCVHIPPHQLISRNHSSIQVFLLIVVRWKIALERKAR